MSKTTEDLSNYECPVHPTQNKICGGPHRIVLTDLGNEVLAPNEEPLGTPKTPEGDEPGQ